MLQSMRDGAQYGILKVILFGLLAFALLGLVVMDVQGVWRGGAWSNNVMKIGDERVSIQSFDRTAQMRLSQQGISAQDAYRIGLLDQILLGEAQSILLGNGAQDAGLRISDEKVAEELQTLLAPYTNEDTSTAEAFQRVLTSQGMNEKAFVAALRKEMRAGLVRSALAGAAVVPEPLLEAVYAVENESRDIKAVLLKTADTKLDITPTDADLQAYYEERKNIYLIPARRTLTVAKVDSEKMLASITMDEETLRGHYEENIELFQEPETRDVIQAVFDEKEAAESFMAAGADFDTLNDKEGVYVQEQTFSSDGLSEDIAEPVFAESTKADDLLGPVETALGWHVIRLTKITPPRTLAFDDIKARLESELRVEEMQNRLADMGNDIEDAIAGGKTLDELGATYSLTTVTVGPIDASGQPAANVTLPESLSTEDMAIALDMTRDLEAGEISPVTELSDGSMAFIRVDSRTQETYPEFETIKNTLMAAWQSEEKEKQNRAQAEKLLEDLRAGTATLTNNDISTTVRSFTGIKRSGTFSESQLSPQNVARIFATDKGAYSLASGDDGILVYRVENVTRPDISKADAADIDLLRQKLRNTIANEIMALYLDDLSRKYAMDINRPLLERAYGGEEQN